MKIFEISSIKNEKIKKIIKLKNKNKRDKYSQFLIEGYRELLRASHSGIKIESLFICPSLFLKSNELKLIEEIQKNKVTIYKVREEVFQRISYRDRPDGLLAIANQFHNGISKLQQIVKNIDNPFLIVCESIEKPGNLGTILRTADAAGCDAVIVCDPITDIFNPNVVRASIGTLFTKPVIVCSSKEVLAFLNKNKINILSSTPHSKLTYNEIDLKKPIAIIVGTEQIGLSKKWMEGSTYLVRIPMYGKADSLNVAQATTILLYEAIRQRKFT